MFEGKRVLAILNPSSGAGAAGGLADDIGSTVLGLGAHACAVRRTEGPEDAFDWSAAAADDGFEVVLAGGGDGTVTAVGHGVLRSQAALPIGILPFGTGNGLARVLGLPLEPMAALRALAGGRIVRIDAVDVPTHDMISLLFFGAGLDARINRAADAREKARLGFLAYVKATFESLRGVTDHSLTLTIDDAVQQVRGHTVVAFNATRVQVLGVPLGPDTQPHDGRMEVAVLQDAGFVATLGRLARLLRRSAGRTELVPARKLHLDADPPLPVQIDGDAVGHTPLEAMVVQRALRFIADASYDGDAPEAP